MDKSLLDQFVKDLSYQSITTRQLLDDSKGIKRRLYNFKKVKSDKSNYKNYFQKIIKDRNSIKNLATKTNTLYNHMIEFLDLANWDKETIDAYKEIQFIHANLYQRNIVGSFQAIEEFLGKHKMYQSFVLKDELIQEYLDYVDLTVGYIIEEIKAFDKKYRINTANASKLRTMLLSQTPQFVSKEMLGQCVNMEYLEEDILQQLLQMIEENNNRFAEYQLERFKLQNEIQEIEPVFIEPSIQTENYIEVTKDPSDYRMERYMDIMKNFYYDSERIETIARNILNKLSDKEYYRLIQKIENEIMIYQELRKDKKCRKKDKKELKEKMEHWKSCIQILKEYKMIVPEKSEENVDHYHLLYATNSSGVPYVLNDLSKLTSDEAKESFLTCLNYLTSVDQYSGDFTKIRKLVNDDSLDAFEAKANQIRLIFNYLPHKCIYILQMVVKKSNKDAYLSTTYAKRLNTTLEQYKEMRSYLKENGFTSELQRREEEMNALILEKLDKKSLQKKK